MSTLRQFFFDPKEGIPASTVHDFPSFDWRGIHVDVARHYLPISSLYKSVDYCLQHKLNVLHLHLTDDQGWRVEIKAYPKLVEIGSKRDSTVKGYFGHLRNQFDKTPVQGYYSQKELKDLVKYAEDRNVTIVPEIEIPGHAQAALASYPESGSGVQLPPLPYGPFYPVRYFR